MDGEEDEEEMEEAGATLFVTTMENQDTSRDYQNPTHPSCQYHHQFDHVIKDFLVLVTNMQENKNHQPTQIIHMMRYESHEDDPSINIVTRRGVSTGEDKVEAKHQELELWFLKASEKNFGFDLHREKEMFVEERNIFMDPGASTSKNHIPLKEKTKEAIAMQD